MRAVAQSYVGKRLTSEGIGRVIRRFMPFAPCGVSPAATGNAGLILPGQDRVHGLPEAGTN
jgi:hypothetical protein